MKTITVRYFAMFREQAGIDEETLSLVGTRRALQGRDQRRDGGLVLAGRRRRYRAPVPPRGGRLT